jgi:energy-coupling factor transport system permease protein
MIRRLDPRTKLAALLGICIAAFLARGGVRLGVLLGVASAWALLCPRASRRLRSGTLLALGVLGPAGALALAAVWHPAVPFAQPLVRLAILLLAGWAFAGSTPVGELACALQKMRCPRAVVLILVAARQMFVMLAGEVRLARDAARVRAGCFPARHPRGAVLSHVWRVSITFCARLFLRADEMAAAAEARGFSRPGTRSSLRDVRFGPKDFLAAAACCAAAVALCVG